MTSEAEAETAPIRLYEGDGLITVHRYRFAGESQPANFVVYDMPPGSSEGIHTHGHRADQPGAFDEYYYVIEGHGEMIIAGQTIAIGPGDHVHAPMGVAHGVRNPNSDAKLRIFLTFIDRAIV